MCVYACTYIYLYTYLYIYIYRYVYMYTYIFNGPAHALPLAVPTEETAPTHTWRGKGLQHLLGATKRAFSLFYIFWNSDYRQRFPLNILKLRLSPEIPTQIDWNLKLQNTTFWYIEVSSEPSPLHPWTVLAHVWRGSDVCVCACICVYIYVYTYIPIHICVCVCVHMYKYIYIHSK